MAAASALASAIPPAVRYEAKNNIPRSRFPPPRRLYRTASRTCVSSDAVCASHSEVNARSIAARSAVHSTAAALLTTVGEVERSVGALDERLHARFRLRELVGGSAQLFDALFEQGERLRQLEIAVLERGRNLLEPREALLESHSVFSLRVRAGTT